MWCGFVEEVGPAPGTKPGQIGLNRNKQIESSQP
jgi:hypothetical protein